MSKPQNMNIEWRYSRAIFDPNQWHEVSESRVDWFFKTPFGNNLHSLDDADATLEIKGIRPQRWQMLPVDNVVGRYVMRSNYTGPELQIGTCYKPDEADDSKTGICLVQSTGEDNQKWDIDFVETTGSTYIFRNVANSSDFVLDCHPGNPIFMNKNFDPAANIAQQWILRPDGEINDDSFSTTYTNLPAGATNKPLPSDLGSDTTDAPRGTTRGDDSSPAATSDPNSGSGSGSGSGPDTVNATDGSSSSSSSQLSAGAVAGVGIGAALGVLLLAGFIFAFLWRRRHNPKSPHAFSRNSNMPEMDGSANGAANGQPGSTGMPSGQAFQMWHTNSPQSDSSVVGNRAPPSLYNGSSSNNNNNGSSINNNNNNNNNMSAHTAYSADGHMNYPPQVHGGSPTPADSPYGAAPQGPSPTGRTQNTLWNDKSSLNYPDGYQAWQGTNPTSPERRPSNGQPGAAPVEAMGTAVRRQELDSTPVDGSQYPRYQ